MLTKIFRFLGLPKTRNQDRSLRVRSKYFKKSTLILLFFTAFLGAQGLAWLPKVTTLSAVAQTPAAVTSPPSTTNPDTPVQEARKLYLQGQAYLTQGQPEAAAKSFSDAATAYEREGDKTGVIKSQINQAEALRKAGYYRRALDILEQVKENLPDKTDPQLKPLEALTLRSLGITQRLIGDLNESKQNVEESLKIAETLPSPAREENQSAAYLMLGNIAKDRGNAAKERSGTSTAQTDTEEAIACNEKPREIVYEKPTEPASEQPKETAPQERSADSYFQEAIACYKKAAETTKTPTAIIEAQLNQLSTFRDSEQPFTNTEIELLRQVRETIDQLPLSRTAVQARINWARMVMARKQETQVSDEDIAQQLEKAIEDAKKLRDYRSQSYALGQLGELYQKQGQEHLDQAQEYTKQALQVAQSIGAGDIAYRWQRQLGQILIAKGGEKDREGAIAYYGAAVNNLKSISGDLVSVNPDVQFSFQEGIKPVYQEFVGLLLESDGTKNNPEKLEKARTAIESLQQAELVNFFRENCLTAKPRSIDEIDKKAAVIYPIVLEDRVEVLVTLPNPDASQTSKTILRHYRTRLSGKVVEDILTSLRQGAPNARGPAGIDVLPNPEAIEANRQQYLSLAQKVYGWLIKPLEEDLTNSKVETLVFILNGPLLNLPMAVLHDGEKFLVQKYAIAQTPGLQLLEPKPLTQGKLTAFKAGISKRVENLPELPEVEVEIDRIDKQVPGAVILNQEFTKDAIQKAIDSAPFPVVHLATHGQFSSNAQETFIVTWNGRLNIDDLRGTLRGREEGGKKAIELLVLSACETATGDKRAALGLAGVAVKAGARSTLATLWQVNDESTAKLMVRFYQELKDTTISKAEALRRAQRSFIEQPEDNKFREPYYWAPFVLVGNWL